MKKLKVSKSWPKPNRKAVSWAVFYYPFPGSARELEEFSLRRSAKAFAENQRNKGAEGILLDHFNSDGDCIKTEEVI